MSIITISRPCCSKGGQIAEKVAEKLGYDCISREILIEASEQFNIPEIKLARAIHDGPTFFEKFNQTKETYIAYIRSALLSYLQRDNVVYHGLAGHFFLQNIPGILKVRTLSTFEDRIKEEMDRNGTSETVARKQLLYEDKHRIKWSLYMYKMDTSDPELYDLVLNLKHLSIDDCVKIIEDTISMECFQMKDETLEVLKNESVAAMVTAALIDSYPGVKVNSVSGKVNVSIDSTSADQEKTKKTVMKTVNDINEISSLSVNVISNTLSHTAMRR